MKIAIIGGGASGLVAAISAAREGAFVTIYERCDRVGRKILATGNGRCNYTNINAGVCSYHGKNPDFVRYALENFNVGDTMGFFRNLGMLTKVESGGKAFPYSLQASGLLDVLRFELARLKINIVTEFEVKSINKENGRFTIESYTGERQCADKVIISAGGKASPSLGSNGSGYALAESFGHKTTNLFPALVQIKTDVQYVKAMKGIKTDAEVKFCTDKVIDKTFGEVLFTDYGVSGPAVFNISRHCGEYEKSKLKLDLLPDISFDELRKMLRDRKSENITLENYFVGMMNKKIGMTVTKYAGVMPYSRMSSTLTSKEISRLCEAIKSFTLEITGTMSWNNAQVTAGGIDTSDVDSKTMQSKLCKGLYLTGEILDIDGDCGGYNLQWAWSSGYLAGKSAAMKP